MNAIRYLGRRLVGMDLERPPELIEPAEAISLGVSVDEYRAKARELIIHDARKYWGRVLPLGAFAAGALVKTFAPEPQLEGFDFGDWMFSIGAGIHILDYLVFDLRNR